MRPLRSGPGRGGARRRRLARIAALIAAAVAAGVLAGGAAAATSDAEITVSAGSLSVTTPDFQPAGVTLDGTAQSVTTTPAAPWSAVDARGTGAAWTVTASATDLVSTGTPNRVIAAGNLALTTGSVTAAAGADPATGITGATTAAFTVPTGPGQTNIALLSAPAGHRGAYAFTPTLGITIPANAQASYAGTPYAAVLTITIS
jgi:hypothetical protein